MREVASAELRMAEVPEAIQRAGPVVPSGARRWAWRAGRLGVGSGLSEGTVMVSMRAWGSRVTSRTDQPFQPGERVWPRRMVPVVGGWEVDSPRKRRESGVGPGARVRREGDGGVGRMPSSMTRAAGLLGWSPSDEGWPSRRTILGQ